jgi:hypothetical protein
MKELIANGPLDANVPVESFVDSMEPQGDQQESTG